MDSQGEQDDQLTVVNEREKTSRLVNFERDKGKEFASSVGSKASFKMKRKHAKRVALQGNPLQKLSKSPMRN